MELVFICHKTGRSFSNQRSYTNHIRSVYKGESLESVFLQETQTEPPKCVFCGDKCKFKSLRCGYFDYCNSHDCKIKNITISNRISANKRMLGVPGYDNIILQNRELFASAFMGNVIVDPYDGKVHGEDKNNSTRYITARSETSILGAYFYENRICDCCETEFRVNFIKDSNKTWCSGECASLLNLEVARSTLQLQRPSKTKERKEKQLFYIENSSLIEFSKQCSDGRFDIFPNELRHLKDKFSIFTSFRKKSTHIIFDTKLQIYCNIALSRIGVLYNATFYELYKSGNLSVKNYTQGRLPDSTNCDVCGKTIIPKYKWDVDENNEWIEPKLISHTYCSQVCYFKFLGSGGKTERYGYSEERKEKQSIQLKNKILSGEFTPNSTNSWCYGRIYYDGIPFRSSWELAFYYYAIKKFNLVDYETVRIPYFCTKQNKTRVYIVDFFINNNILVEVKPKSEMIKSKDKMMALYDYVNDNNFGVIICDEDYIKDVIGNDCITEILDLELDDSIKHRIVALKRGLFNVNI